MATIAIGDIHGNLPALRDLLRQVRSEVAPEDAVVFLGDYIDRGPDSKGCIGAILEFKCAIRAKVVCLRGNHEDWLLRTKADYTRHSWLTGMEAFDTIGSYSPDAVVALRDALSTVGPDLFTSRQALPYDAFFEAVPTAHLSFLEDLSLFYRAADGICVHAGLDPLTPRVEDQPASAMLWGTADFPSQYHGAETVAYGHWDNADLDSAGWPRPRIVGLTIGLDTISHGVLTAVRLTDRRIFQSARCRPSARRSSV